MAIVPTLTAEKFGHVCRAVFTCGLNRHHAGLTVFDGDEVGHVKQVNPALGERVPMLHNPNLVALLLKQFLGTLEGERCHLERNVGFALGLLEPIHHLIDFVWVFLVRLAEHPCIECLAFH